MRITKVYTRTGDNGETSLVGGQRVSKASPRVEAYGELDEINSLLGVARAEISDAEIHELLGSIQNELFTAGADLASPKEIEAPRIESGWVTRLEQILDHYNEQLPPLREFILPSGSKGAVLLHLARTVTRRAERRIVELSQQEDINEALLAYMNRLSDLLFVLARVTNQRLGTPEEQADFSRRGK
jgi:cob(I)alamin adenosyltransferase